MQPRRRACSSAASMSAAAAAASQRLLHPELGDVQPSPANVAEESAHYLAGLVAQEDVHGLLTRVADARDVEGEQPRLDNGDVGLGGRRLDAHAGSPAHAPARCGSPTVLTPGASLELDVERPRTQREQL